MKTNYFKSNCQDLLKKLDNQKLDYEKQLKALQSIKKVYKKDWKEFSSFMKNFEIWKDYSFYKKSYPFNDYYYIRYWSWKELSFISYTVDKDFIEKIEKEDPTRIVKQEYLKDKVYFNPSELFNNIQDRIEYIKIQLKKTDNFIKNFDKICNWLEKKLNSCLEYLDNFDFEYYDLRDLIENTVKTYFKS